MQNKITAFYAILLLALLVLIVASVRQAFAAGADGFTPGSSAPVRRFAAPASGISFPTNAVASWPTNAATPGGCQIVMSNHVVYLLTSTPASRTWAATNKLGP